MKHLLILFAIFFSLQISFAQQMGSSTLNTNKGLSDSEFIIAKEAYVKLADSELYKAEKKAMLELIEKLPSASMEFFIDDEAFIKWINENLNSTKFKNLEEALALRKLCFDLQEKIEKENPEVYEFMTRASVEQLKEILRPERLSPLELGY